MKIIFLAAGQGSRLWKYTRKNPKGMIDFAGKTLLKHNIDNFKNLGVTNIIIVRGYMSHKINFNNVTYYDNDNFMKTNMVESLFCAKSELDDDCIIVYSDILLDRRVMKKIISSEFDIGVTVDCNFKDYWISRLGESFSQDMESLKINSNKVTDIGGSATNFEEVDGRYVGAIKLSTKGVSVLKDKYKEYKSAEKYNSLGNRSIENWHMTDLLKCLILDNIEVNPIIISKGWLEFDTESDYEKYLKWYQEDRLKRFININ